MTNYRPLRRGTLVFLSGPVPHLHIVINDPVVNPITKLPSVVLVNISSIRDGVRYDEACVLTPDNCAHSFVNRPSYVLYARSYVKAVDDIIQRVEIGEFETRDPLPEDAFEMVVQGFRVSRSVPPKVQRFLKHCF
ncbi:hypothetical protein [Salinicola lusitanus]|uniref:hypothetical protein n=1 Tax=Salinicola lusitanus TaxID=1949085 RepID=UPI0013007D8B|nr:hypothetical protein [Salinicola lusitanus]